MKISIRDLFLTILIAAFGCAWWLQSLDAGTLRTKLQELRADNIELQDSLEAMTSDHAFQREVAIAFANELNAKGHSALLTSDSKSGTLRVVELNPQSD